MLFRYHLLVSCVLFALAGCSTTSSSSNAESKTGKAGKAVPIDQQAFMVVPTTNQIDPKWLQMPTNLFRLGPGDQIEIEMLGEGAARSTVFVGPDGKIYYSLLPGLFVWDLTLLETKNLIDQKLQQFFKEKPQVAITLRGVGSRRIWLLGNMQSPGVYGLATPMTLLEAISLAGGPAPSVTGSAADTDWRRSFVMRAGQPLSVDFEQLFLRGDFSQNIYLEPDDFVYLKPGGGQFVYMLGAVGHPGAVPFVNRMTLATAIASVGGTIPYAQGYDVAIVRGPLKQPSVTSANYKAIIKGQALDVLLEPDDMVYVPFVPFKKVLELADGIIRQFVSTVALNEGTRAVIPYAPPVGISVSGSSVTAPPRPAP